MEKEKMKDTVSAFEMMVKVFGIVTKICGFVCLVFAVLTLLFGEKMFAAGELTLDLDFLKLHLAESLQTNSGALQIYAVVGLLTGSVLCFVMSYACSVLRRILASVKAGRPFEAAVVTDLRKIGWSVIVGGAVSALLGVVERHILTRAYPMEEIFAAEAVTRVEYVYTMDFGFVLTACAIFLLSYIFSYGQALQRESDETL